MQIAARQTFWRRGKKSPSPAYWGLCFTAEEAGSTISMSSTGTPVATNFETSNDGITWSPFLVGGTTITLPNVGDKVYFRAPPSGYTQLSNSTDNYTSFLMSGRVAASGDATSMLDASAPVAAFSEIYTMQHLFSGCTALTTAPELPATTVAGSCYREMFSGCTALTTAPELPATTIGANCYRGMFSGCTALTTAPDLPATRLYIFCYQEMFSGCTALTTAPELSATTLYASCYRGMFSGCTALTTAPELPATTASATYIYYMMFSNCTSLERTGRIAIATAKGANALVQMFAGCSKLKYIELAGMTAWSTRMTDWVNGVAATGTFKCPAALGTNETITRGTSNCPNGWTVVNI